MLSQLTQDAIRDARVAQLVRWWTDANSYLWSADLPGRPSTWNQMAKKRRAKFHLDVMDAIETRVPQKVLDVAWRARNGDPSASPLDRIMTYDAEPLSDQQIMEAMSRFSIPKRIIDESSGSNYSGVPRFGDAVDRKPNPSNDGSF